MSDDITIDSFGGNCPVQGEGTVDGKPFYFRARGRRWTLSIGGEDLIAAPEWHYEESYGDDEFAAGWMGRDEALEFLAQGIARYRRGEASMGGPIMTRRIRT